jgi:DNA-binding SARP family transcriptional activator
VNVRVRLLGPVELWGSDGQVDLGGPQQRCVFTVLAITPRQTVPVDVLVDRVWGERIPRNVRTVLYTYVSRLRGLLRQADGGDRRTVLRRRDGGYVLELDPGQVDLHQARKLAADARAAGHTPPGTARAAALLAQACELWSGTPLAGVTSDWAERVRVGLEHERRALLSERFEAAIRIGQHDAVIGPLSEALAAYPLTESLAALLMLALHRAGRDAEALEVYGQLRRRMIDELGDEPGAGLRRLHEQLLRRDPGLDPRLGPAGQTAAPIGLAAPWLPLCQLPPDTWHFVGRERLASELAAAVEPDRRRTAVAVVTVTGLPGAGKTALAIRVAHRVRERFPDGQWFVRLGGTDAPRDPAELLGELLEASGIDPEAVPAGLERRTAALRARVADRRVLILLDDAADAAQVRPLLPGTAGAAVLVTSRRLLSGLAGTAGVRLGPLGPDRAVEFLGRLAGPDRVAAEPDAAAEISAACGRLPLALRIAGVRLAARPEWRLERFAARLRDRRRRLDELAVGDLAVRPELARCVRALDPPCQAALHRLAARGTLDFTARTAGELARGRDGDHLIDSLVAANLVDPAGAAPGGEPRYRLPELVAAYADELAG